ncbi:LytR C-terminal domain-containing protein [Haliovirga abyssi]|uniref:LytR/CpsA/Psr regulator C-terminal domain-containing protein n=1 Tax=Haliovirga abyssi TaxID=2996794 RepID=A0AAU9E0N0_9FUSO|nr:LytR C-terminal domain-containing protein [Haliovirga abyssi]BDU49890.1 hypothetical protein HLVA_04590 [Haliovirga abyssi]
MVRKKRKIKPRFFIILSILSGIVFYFLFLDEPLKIKKVHNIITTDNFILIKNNELYLVYDKKIGFKLPKDTIFSKTEEINKLIKRKEYRKLLLEINYFLPEKLDDYFILNEYNMKNIDIKNIPRIKIGDKLYFDSYSFSKILNGHSSNTVNLKNKNIIVDVLNGNGKSGYAKKIGELLKKKLGYRYNPANYEKYTEYSYIINKNLSKDELEKIAINLPEKYIKKMKNYSVDTLANSIVILGREKKIGFSIWIYTNKILDRKYYNKLKEKKYVRVHRSKKNRKIIKTYLEYNSEDYFTAYKMGKVLGVDNLVENNNIKNKINIYVEE